MVLELHIWGPAFSIPSIDAQCIATVAYFTQAVPQGEWVVIASSDPSLCPTNELPALKSGTIWISRFRNIVDYLRQLSNGEWDLDHSLNKQEKADCIAFSSFAESQGQPLIDLSLYVSSLNYSSSTLRAWAELLQWPNQWIVPPKMRAAAKRRTEHLGLSSLDVDSVDDQKQNETLGADQIPKSLLQKPRETVTSLLGRSTHRSQFRLDAITARFGEPLQELLGQKMYFFSETSMSSLDCLALGYLSLALIPQLSHPWLHETLKPKFSALAVYAERVSQKCFQTPVNVSNALVNVKEQAKESPHGKGATPHASSLPWQAPARASMSTIGYTVLQNMADSTPILKQFRANERLKQAATDAELGDLESKQLEAIAKAMRREQYSQIVTVATGISAFIGYLFYTGIVSLPKREESDEKPDFGEAGELLGINGSAA